MKKIKVYLGLLLVFPLVLFSAIKNVDKPAKGEWHFNLEEVWTVNEIGDKVLARPLNLLVSDDGTIYFYDAGHKENYIWDKSGKFVKTFAKRGEGPGEVKRQFSSYLVSDKIIIADVDKIHYFTADGEYIRSVKNHIYSNDPIFFQNENTFIFATKVTGDSKQKTGQISLFNLKSGVKSDLTEFSIFRKATVHTGQGRYTLLVESLTPLMIIGHENNRIYYGMNHTYEITTADSNGKKINIFSLERSKKSVSQKDKKDHFKGLANRVPPETLKKIIDGLPNELTYFVRIEVHKGLIYVFATHWGREESQQIDIFSPEGKYLYRSFIRLADGLTFTDPQNLNPVIKKDHVYVILENEEGSTMISKYKINLPGI